MNFRGKKILVVGFGASGRAAVRFFQREGAEVAVTDDRFGKNPPEVFKRRDLILVSPGVPLDLPGLKLARRYRIPIIGEFGLAAEWIQRRGIPIIAVTGTNGKSTTVTLIAEILKKGGKKVALAGNIGRPLLEVVMDDKKLDWVVAEVSSYQLETAPQFRPRIGVLLNITEDHLDRYKSMRQYASAKFRIFGEQGKGDFLIYNKDDPIIFKGVRRARAKKIPITGILNSQNQAAAAAVARLVGVPPAVVQKVFENFKGLPHRVEFVRRAQGVRYYDDSKGTNVDAVVKALSGFPDRRVILIAGGRDKGGSYAPLREMVQKKARLIILIGEGRHKMQKALRGKTEIVTVEKLEEAVPLAAKRAEAGDVVLLSPACSSFDQFRDYKERGDLFQKLVKGL